MASRATDKGEDSAEAPGVDQLAGKMLFAGLEREQLSRLREVVRVRRVEAGAVIVREHDYGDALFLVHRGVVSVRVEVRDDVLGRSEQVEVARWSGSREGDLCVNGDFFGEMCLLDLEPRSATVVAVVPSELWEINRDDLYWLFGDDKGLQLRILMTIARVLGRRLGQSGRPVGADCGGDEDPGTG